jgi:hypothetical protein
MELEQKRVFDHYIVGYSPELEMYIMQVEAGGIATYFNCFRLTEKEYRSGDFGRLHAKFFKQGTRSDRYLSSASLETIRNNKEPRDVSVYDYIISNDNFDCIPVSEDVIRAAEEKMGREFPYELRWFYQDVGCGSIKGNKHLINRIMTPKEAAGITMPDQSIPFINVAEGAYVVLRPDGKVGYFDKTIANTLFEFWEKEADKPDYYVLG